MRAGTPAPLAELQRARRQRRLSHVDWFEAFYQAYLTGLGVAVATIVASTYVPDVEVAPATAARVASDGPALLGLGIAAIVALGLRSGGRGGPLALEAPTVVHVLLAPVDRAAALRPTAARQLRFGAFVGAVVGAVAGLLAARRLPIDPYAGVVCASVAGALVAIATIGAALTASGRRWSMPRANLVAGVVVGAAAADVAAGTAWSPTTQLGGLALWSLDVEALSLVGAAVAVAVAAVGLSSVGGISLEAARRRAGLVAELRFAVTLQDLRTVVLLRRRLTQERSRSTPWLRLPAGGRASRLPVWRRDWEGVLRFPGARLVRMAGLGVIAGAALWGVWGGTSTLILVAGVALYVAALDAVEPLAQEVDHPDRWTSVPVAPGRLLVRHLAVPTVTMVVVGTVVAGSAAILGSASPVLALFGILAIPVAISAAVGAAASTAQGQAQFKASTIALPEAAGTALVVRNVWPVALVVISLVPVLAARSATGQGMAIAPAAAITSVSTLVLTAAAVVWLWHRRPAQR
ncbi:MAG: hypothetical protein KY450_07430 [Actinobacteria bacterium]|nr:hypothetical protein [Actinomycetota bacterium]